jgi:hypothetical protein
MSNESIDYSKKIQEARKGRLLSRAGRETRGPLPGIRSWGLGVGYLDPKNLRNSKNLKGSQFLAKREVKVKREKTVAFVFGEERKKSECSRACEGTMGLRNSCTSLISRGTERSRNSSWIAIALAGRHVLGYHKVTSLLILIALVAAICGASQFAFATDTGSQSPANIVENVNIGTQSWSDLSEAGALDFGYATVKLKVQISHYLWATVFGFTIPDGATINGIVVGITRMGDQGSGTYVSDNTVQLVKSGSLVAENKALTESGWGTSDFTQSYGSSIDLWNTSWTSADINNTDFGVAISVKGNSSTSPLTASVDTVTITVHYTPANNPPVITEGASTSVTMDEDGSPTAWALTLNATDADGDT